MKGSQLPLIAGGIALAGIGGLMAITNPGQNAYQQYATEELSAYLKDNVCPQLPKGLQNFLQSQCKALVDVGRPQIEQLISHQTRRQNFILFSIYQTNLSVTESFPSYHFETVGILQNFYIYQAEQL